MKKPNLLITGLPGTGKTTLIARFVQRLRDMKIAGFYTAEIREGESRKGFEIVDLRGERVILSHVDIRGSQRVGKYGVDVAGFEQYLETVPFFSAGTDLVIIDEIGKMECLSMKFRRIVLDLLDAPVTVVATIALHGGGIIDSIKARPDVHLYELTRENGKNLLVEIEMAAKVAPISC